MGMGKGKGKGDGTINRVRYLHEAEMEIRFLAVVVVGAAAAAAVLKERKRVVGGRKLIIILPLLWAGGEVRCLAFPWSREGVP